MENAVPPILDYPVTEVVVAAPREYPRLGRKLRFRPGERRPLYIRAVLVHSHYDHNRVAPWFIEDALPWSGSIGASLLHAGG